MPTEKRIPREKRIRIDRIPKVSEIENGPKVPIQLHTNQKNRMCPGTIGQVTKFDDFKQPMEAICITKGCGKKALIDWVKIQANTNLWKK